MAPMISVNENRVDIQKFKQNLKKEKKQLIEIRKFIENNFEYVGKNFSKKAREIYYDKKNNHWI